MRRGNLSRRRDMIVHVRLIAMVPGTPHRATLKPKLPIFGEFGSVLEHQGGGYRNLPTVSMGIVRIA
jgi:hypothetical protein